jgi:hypothetical protein
MDYSQIGFTEVWQKEAKAHSNAETAKWHAGLFSFFALNLLVSIVRTISTGPGTIPDHKEWDMNTASDSIDEDVLPSNLTRSSQLFTNLTIDQNTNCPRELAHEDYKYLVTGCGPLINSTTD